MTDFASSGSSPPWMTWVMVWTKSRPMKWPLRSSTAPVDEGAALGRDGGAGVDRTGAVARDLNAAIARRGAALRLLRGCELGTQRREHGLDLGVGHLAAEPLDLRDGVGDGVARLRVGFVHEGSGV